MKYAKRVAILAAFITISLIIILYNSLGFKDYESLKDHSDVEESISQIEMRLANIRESVHKSASVLPNFPEIKRPDKPKEEFKLPAPDQTDKFLETHCVSPRGELSGTRISETYEEIAFNDIDGGVWKQGWPVTYDESEYTDKDPLEVFIVPHSHNDPGWIKTFWDYYNSQTRNILDNIVDILTENEQRRFIWAEISYLDLWWKEQKEDRKNKFRKLVLNGQLEISTAGWVMNDEANTHYSSMIDQLFEGHQWTRDNISPNFMPKTSWCIDPFGTSPTMAYILNRAGIPYLAMQRVHYEVKKYLARQKRLEFSWRQSWAVGTQDSSTDTFTHLFPFYSYDIPHTCGPDPKICCQFDFKRMAPDRLTCPWGINARAIDNNNIQERASTLVDQYKKHSTLYGTNKLLIILGDDFRYQTYSEAHAQFDNYERLFQFINSNKDMHTKIQWGTLNEYFQAVMKEKNQLIESGSPKIESFQPISGDFFTYADRRNHYWSGYYTSRPFYKEMDRDLRSHLRAAEIFYSLARIQDTTRMEGMYDMLVTSRQNAALFQHHDGVTGTAKTFVNNDYGERMLTSLKNCENVISQSTQILMGHHSAENIIFDIDEHRVKQDGLPQRITIDTGSEDRYVVFVNSLGHERRELVSIRVNSVQLAVFGPSGENILAQISPAFDFPFQLRDDAFDLYFEITVPPLGASQYKIERREKGKSQVTVSKLYFHNHAEFKSNTFTTEPISDSEISFENSYITATFTRNQATLTAVHSSEFNTKVIIEFLTYISNFNSRDDRSGAYLFIPIGSAKIFRDMNSPNVFVQRGELISKICGRFLYLTHCSSLIHTKSIEATSVQFENYINLIVDNEEVVMRLKTSVKSKGENYFYTDLNGLTVQRRKYHSKLGIQGNFYPMPTLAYIEDINTRVSIHSKQSLGVGSLENGCIEVMLDRRPIYDDSRGLEQGVTDNKAIVGKFRLHVEYSQQGIKEANSELSFPSLVSQITRESLQNPIFKLVMKAKALGADSKYSGLSLPLPCDLQIVNIRALSPQDPTKSESALILHKFIYNCELPTTGIPFNHCGNQDADGVDITKLFSKQRLVEITHTSLTMLQEMKPKVKSSIANFDSIDIKSYKLTFATNISQ
ncbi:Alpha-mannosidase 2 [Oopsacas minuta]|uniref:Alpha-mannosidase n=1 Tax=Oopsacas minuta TaxID=111878 RepID=A0AAV7JJ08_9METZ|nr:Alpha-mannosidase 2 [Oopsacas minuta]